MGAGAGSESGSSSRRATSRGASRGRVYMMAGPLDLFTLNRPPVKPALTDDDLLAVYAMNVKVRLCWGVYREIQVEVSFEL